MMRKKEGFAMNNKGSTLVEIIVSVLIIAIVFVPLLMGMSAALKANGKAEQALNSENAAVNCMEAVKAVGRKGIEALAPTEAATGGPTLTPVDASAVFGPDAKIIRQKEIDPSTSEVKEYFLVTDIKEGLENYSAIIRFSEDKYLAPTPTDGATITPTPLFNDYKYISFSNLSGKGTQMLKFLSEEDASRVTNIRSLSGKAVNTEMLEADWTTADIVKTKEVELIIDKDASDNYSISSKINYTMYNNLGGAFRFVQSSSVYTVNDDAPRTIQCKYGKPDTLVIYFSPISHIKTADDTFDHSADKSLKNKLAIKKNTELDGLRVYVIVTGEDMENGTTKNTYMDVEIIDSDLDPEHEGKTDVFCSAEYNSATGNFIKVDDLYQKGAETLKIYDVIIEVEDVEKTGTIIE